MAGSLQHDQAAQRIGIPPACAAKHRANRPEADDALTIKPDYPIGALQGLIPRRSDAYLSLQRSNGKSVVKNPDDRHGVI